ncbi:MAG: anaerobic ribonucleoside-triphosphate reductase activating protein [Victivallales bacterium]|nr:anaerobic ribonucleoside-triphosphate reductase activating protein [Victivallales bacterium]
MNFRGILKFSLVDYPGKLSCILFTGGCNFRCPYCQNPYLVLYEATQPKISEREVFSFMESRRRKLDAVVISGGEPTLRRGLANFAEKVKAMGFLVKIDTNGSEPDMVLNMVDAGIVDMLGIDYKAPAAKYSESSGVEKPEFAKKVSLLIKGAVERGVPCDIRTTVHKRFLSKDDLVEMRKELDALNVGKWCLQQFHKVEVIDESLLDEPTYTNQELQKIVDEIGGGTFLRGM